MKTNKCNGLTTIEWMHGRVLLKNRVEARNFARVYWLIFSCYLSDFIYFVYQFSTTWGKTAIIYERIMDGFDYWTFPAVIPELFLYTFIFWGDERVVKLSRWMMVKMFIKKKVQKDIVFYLKTLETLSKASMHLFHPS